MKIEFLDTAKNRIEKYGSIDKAMENARELISIYRQGIQRTGPYYSHSRDELLINQEVLYRLGQIKRRVYEQAI